MASTDALAMAVSPASDARAPGAPAAVSMPGRASSMASSDWMASCSVGCESSTTTKRDALASGATNVAGARRGTGSLGPMTSATPGRVLSSSPSRASTAASVAPGPSTSSSVGAVTPATKPASTARESDARPLVRPSPSSRSRSGEAATSRPPVSSTTTRAATPRVVSRRVAIGARSVRAGWASPLGKLRRGQKAPRPRIASRAGSRVTDTTTPTTAVRARAGANARKKSTSPISSVAVPRAVVSPAVSTMAIMWALAPIAACGARFSRSRERTANR